MRPTTVFCLLALSVWFTGEILAQEQGQELPIAQSDQDQQDQQVQRGQTGDRGQKGQRGQRGQRGKKGQGGQQGQDRGGNRALNLERLLQRMDRNGDEDISKDELPQRMQARFDAMDINGDGVFDRAEQAVMLERIQEMSRGRKQGLGGPQGAGSPTQRRGENFPQLLEKMDKNSDGELTKDELPERMQQRFETLDTNANGVFDKDEQLAAVERMRQRGEKGGKQKRDGNRQDKQGVKPKRPGGDGG